MIRPRTAVEAKIPAASRPSEVNWARTIAAITRIAASSRSRRRIVSRVRVERETCETADAMEANLVGGEVAKPETTFPYSNWGPWPAVFAVPIALAVRPFPAVPALIVGSQEGKVEALFPPSYSSGASFDKGDATAIAVDSQNSRLFADHLSEIRAFGPLGQAWDPRSGTLYVSEEGPGRIEAFRPATNGTHILVLGTGGVEPERMAV